LWFLLSGKKGFDLLLANTPYIGVSIAYVGRVRTPSKQRLLCSSASTVIEVELHFKAGALLMSI